FFACPNSDSTFTSPPNDFGTLKVNGDGSYTYTAVDQTQVNFNSSGQMTSKVDPHGLQANYTYSSTTGPLSTITQPDGAKTTFVYSGGLLSVIYEPGSRTVTVTMATINSNSHKVTSIQNPDSSTRSFQYDSMLHLTNDQWGPTNTTLVYDSHGRVSQVQMGKNSLLQDDNLGVTAAVEQGISGGTSLVNGAGVFTDALGHPVTYVLDNLGRLTGRVTADGAVQTWVRNAAGFVVSYTDGMNHTTTFGYSGPNNSN